MENNINTVVIKGCTCSKYQSKHSHTYGTYKMKETNYRYIAVCRKCSKQYTFPKISLLIKELEDNHTYICTKEQMLDYIKNFEVKYNERQLYP